jgi:hypothetical protein
MDVLNHRLSAEFFAGLNRFYSYLGSESWRPESAWRRFANHRNEVLRKELQDRLDAGPLHGVRIDSATRIEFLVDGFPERGRYRGWYFDGQQVDVRLADERRGPATHWYVNGDRVEGERLSMVVREPLVIRPGHDEAPDPETPAETAEDPVGS